MKAADFTYVKPGTVAEALAILSDPKADAMPLAGGQSLMPMMNFRLAAPGTLVDLNGVAALRGIRIENQVIRIGAMNRYSDLAASADIAKHVPLFGMALPHIAHAAIRNRGTIGGSVALADPAAEMPALLLALDATIHVEGPSGPRQIEVDAFFLGMYETALDEGELVTEIAIPAAKPRDRFSFYELARRHGDYAMAGVALKATETGTFRVAFFSVADRAIRPTATEAALQSGDIPAAITALDDLPFTGDLNAAPQTKRHLAGIALKRAVERLAQ